MKFSLLLLFLYTVYNGVVSSFHISPSIYDMKIITQIPNKRHIVCESTIPLQIYPNIIDTANIYSPSLSYDMHIMRIPSIDELHQLMEPSPTPSSIQQHTMFHQLRYETEYKDKMSYERFCYLEERLAQITKSYIMDQLRHWCLIIDPTLLYHDSMPSYWSKKCMKSTMFVSTTTTIGHPDLILWNDQNSNTS